MRRKRISLQTEGADPELASDIDRAVIASMIGQRRAISLISDRATDQ